MKKRKKVAHREPKVGSKYERTFKGNKYTLTVKSKNGKILYEVDGKLYESPSGAASSITNNYVNGWAFWKID